MEDVYARCPCYENEDYRLRLVDMADQRDLLRVYADPRAVPLFNSDNCGGDDFHYTTRERMAQAIEYWLFEYRRRGFVRWTVIDREAEEAVGTIELFHRDAEDPFTNCGLLRLDLRGDHETQARIIRILTLILEPAYGLFHCDQIATKAVAEAVQRLAALKRLGFEPSADTFRGHDGTAYGSYFVLRKQR